MARRVRFAGLLFALVLLAAGCDWSMFGYDATRSGYSPETTLTPANVGTLAQQWTAQLPTTFATDPVVAGGKVFVGANPGGSVTTGALQAFDATGATNCTRSPVACTPLWSVSFPPGQDQSTGWNVSSPVVSGSDVYVGTTNIQPLASATGVGAYATADGTQAFWSSPGGGSWPAVTGGYAYLETTEIVRPVPFTTVEYLGAYAASNGAQQFVDTDPSASGFNDPAVANGVTYATSNSFPKLDAFDAAGVTNCGPSYEPPSWVGEVYANQWCGPLWTGTLAHTASNLPAVANSSVYVADSQGTVSVFAAAGCGASTCSPTWSASAGRQSLTSPAVAGSALFVGSADGTLYAFPAKGCGNATCSPAWTASLGSAADAVSVAGSVVFVTTTDGHLEAFDSGGCGQSTCNPLVSIAVGNPVHTAPAVSSGRVFVTDTAGIVHAYGLPS